MQVVATVVMSSAVAELLAFNAAPFAYLTAGPPVVNTALIMLLVVVASILLDVWVTPIPFRLVYIAPAIMLNVAFTFAAGSSLTVVFSGTSSRRQVFLT